MGLEEASEKLEERLAEAPTTDKEGTPESAPQLVDLDKTDKFMWRGKEMTREDLEKSYMMQSDYTKKTQALAEERKYADNLHADILTVLQNPALIDNFKSLYPQKYHRVLEALMEGKAPSTEATSDMSSAMKKELESFRKDIEAKYEPIVKDYNEQKVKSFEQQIDSKLNELKKKYEHLDEETVLARAQAAVDQKIDLNDDAWDKIAKAVHERNQKNYEAFYTKKFEATKEAAKKGQDIGRGGGTAGAPNKKTKLNDVANEYLASLGGRH